MDEEHLGLKVTNVTLTLQVLMVFALVVEVLTLMSKFKNLCNPNDWGTTKKVLQAMQFIIIAILLMRKTHSFKVCFGDYQEETKQSDEKFEALKKLDTFLWIYQLSLLIFVGVFMLVALLYSLIFVSMNEHIIDEKKDDDMRGTYQ